MSETAAPPAGDAPPQEAESQALVRRDGPGAWIDRPVIDQVPARQLEVIKRTVARGATNAELAMYLEVAASLDLNPFTHEIWCAVSEGRDGGRRQVLIMVGRDGLLKVARRADDYLGYDSAVVREKDTYERVEPNPEGKTLRERAGIVHRGEGFGSKRGQILGAWCAVERAGKPIRVFEAPVEEYLPTSQNKLKYSPWGSNLSVMIEKCALSVAHRTSFDLSGVLGEGEEHRALDRGGDGEGLTLDDAEALREAVMALDAPEDVRERILTTASALNEIERDLYNPARIQMTLMGQPVEVVEEAAAKMELELEARREAEPPDAEVVEEPAPDADRQERIEALLSRAEGLESRMQEAEPGSEEFATLSDELDAVNAELESLSDGE